MNLSEMAYPINTNSYRELYCTLDSHNKWWGIATHYDNRGYTTFYGRRDSRRISITEKRFGYTNFNIQDLYRAKIIKGYSIIPAGVQIHLDQIMITNNQVLARFGRPLQQIYNNLDKITTIPPPQKEEVKVPRSIIGQIIFDKLKK